MKPIFDSFLRPRLVVIPLTVFSMLAVCSAFSARASVTRAIEPPRLDSASIARLVDSLVPAAMRDELIPGTVVAVVFNDKLIYARGFGVSDTVTRRPVTPDSTIFRIGSVSKVFTATAVVQLVERGAIALNKDVNTSLTRLRVPSTYPAPVTPFHLLTHSAEFDEIRPGTQAETEAGVLPLDSFLRGKLVRLGPPGVVTSYSTYGITLAGLLVEDASKVSFEEYLRRNVWMPLGMDHTSIRIAANAARLVATPYDVEDGKLVPAPWEWYHTTPASSINSTAVDMARFMATMLNGGTLPASFGGGAGRRILSAASVRSILSRKLTMHPKLPGFGYTWQESDTNGEQIWEHGGDVAGFATLMTLLPERHLGVFVASHREGANLRYALRRALLDRFYPRSETQPVVMLGNGAIPAQRFAGHYRATIICHTCANPRPVTEVDVTSRSDGSLYFWNTRWIQTSPAFFRSEDGVRRVGFRIGANSNVTHMSAGSYQVLERVR